MADVPEQSPETQPEALPAVVPLGADAPAVVPLGADAPEPESGERVVETQGVVYTLKTKETKTLEEEEDVIFNMRAKLYRFEDAEEPAEWKERGTGDLKLLQHKETKKIRVLMRRDITLKICANHYVPNVGNDKSWVYHVAADFADETPKPEKLAVRFANVENATKFKAAMESAKAVMKELEASAPASK